MVTIGLHTYCRYPKFHLNPLSESRKKVKTYCVYTDVRQLLNCYWGIRFQWGNPRLGYNASAWGNLGTRKADQHLQNVDVHPNLALSRGMAKEKAAGLVVAACIEPTDRRLYFISIDILISKQKW